MPLLFYILMFFMFIKYKNYNRKNYNIKFLIIVKDKKNSVGELL